VTSDEFEVLRNKSHSLGTIALVESIVDTPVGIHLLQIKVLVKCLTESEMCVSPIAIGMEGCSELGIFFSRQLNSAHVCSM
jgi:hypothetical protein